MKLFVQNGMGGRDALTADQMNFVQTKQAAAIVDSIARLIPHEGVDYDIQITFKGGGSPSVSMDVVALTEKGAFWRKYVSAMLAKNPPKVEYDGEVLPKNPSPEDYPETRSEEPKEVENAEVVS